MQFIPEATENPLKMNFRQAMGKFRSSSICNQNTMLFLFIGNNIAFVSEISYIKYS